MDAQQNQGDRAHNVNILRATLSTPKEKIAAAVEHRYGERLARPELPSLEALALLNEGSVCCRYKRDRLRRR